MDHALRDIPLEDLEHIERALNPNPTNDRSNRRLTCLDKYDRYTLFMLFLALNVVIVFLLAMMIVILDNIKQRACVSDLNEHSNRYADLSREYIELLKKMNLNNQ